MKPTLVLDSIETYKESTLKRLKWQVKDFFENHSAVEVSHFLEMVDNLNAYENINHLKPLSEEHVEMLDENRLDTKEAELTVLNGEVFWEHAAAGEATRLGLGTKYLLYLNELTVDKIVEMQQKEIEKDYSGEEREKKLLELTRERVKELAGCESEDTLPLNLGTRHMLQLAFDIRKLAQKHSLDEEEVIGKQKNLVIMNEGTWEKIVEEWKKYKFFGFSRRNAYFMVQKSFHGIDVEKGEPFYDESHDGHKRLHNHGQMAMQKTHDDEIFRIGEDGNREYLKAAEFEKILSGMRDMLSYNIEDIKFLTNAIDYHSLALVLELGAQGYGMVMEIVGQNPLKPQKGGAAFYDEKLGRPVMIESNQLQGIKNEDITHLNKNFNHYPNPVKAFRALKSGEMHMHTTIKKVKDEGGEDRHYLYFCTPQGDINFHVKTAYVMRKVLKPIWNWKSPATTPPTVKACYMQDQQEGFKGFTEKMLGGKK